MSRLFEKYGDHTQPFVAASYSKEDVAWNLIEKEVPDSYKPIYSTLLNQLLEMGETPSTAADIIINYYYNNQP
jgi:hypothetical protein